MSAKKPAFLLSVRFSLSIVCFFINAIHYMQRVNLSVAIICMVNHNNCSTSLSLPLSLPPLAFPPPPPSRAIREGHFFVNESTNVTATFECSSSKFNWSKTIQGMLLSSIFIGMILSQILGGWLALIVGPKKMLGSTLLIASILTMLSPPAASLSYIMLIAFRFFIGIAQGCCTNSMYQFWASWAPPAERSILLSLSNSGSLIGNALCFLIGGILCESGFLDGWPSIFYITGLCGVLCSMLWFLVAADTPEKHDYIGDEECDYIVDTTAEIKLSIKKRAVPWRAIFTSVPVNCLILTTLCNNFGVALFTTCLPSYMAEVLHFNIKLNGELSAIPFLTCSVFIMFSAVVADMLAQKTSIAKIVIRKAFNTIGFFIPILTFVGLMFVTLETKVVGFLLILINISFSGFIFGAGFFVNFSDIAGSYSGLCYGIANTIGTASSVIAPFLVNVLTSSRTQEEWRLVFFISSIIYSVGAACFLLFGSGDTQPWAKNADKSLDASVAVVVQNDEDKPMMQNSSQ